MSNQIYYPFSKIKVSQLVILNFKNLLTRKMENSDINFIYIKEDNKPLQKSNKNLDINSNFNNNLNKEYYSASPKK